MKRLFRLGSALSAAALCGCIEAAPAAIEHGTILSAVPINQAGENTGAGAIAGAVIGAAAGGAIGMRGAGVAVGVALGGAVGATAGSSAEAASQPKDGIAYTIRLDDSRVVTVLTHIASGAPVFVAGARVGLETSGRVQHVVPES